MKFTIVVGSENPVKIETTRHGFEAMFPGVELKMVGVKASSGVSDQPLSEEETMRGACGRISSAKLLHPGADFYVGLEGGAVPEHEVRELHQFAWIVVEDSKGKIGKGRTGTFLAPAPFYELVVEKGMECGDAGDLVFDEDNSKQKMGSTGLLTDNVITRSEFYRHAVIFALIPFKKPELY